MNGVSSVSQLIMQQLLMQSVRQSAGQLGRAAEANGKMEQAAREGETVANDYAKG